MISKYLKMTKVLMWSYLFSHLKGRTVVYQLKKGNNIECFCNNIYDYYDNFDVSYETYLWLDSDGHGVNGAPYDMKDIYEDMAWCQNKIYDIYLAVYKYIVC